MGVAGSAIGILARILDMILSGSLGITAAGGIVFGVIFILLDVVIIALLVQNKQQLAAA